MNEFHKKLTEARTKQKNRKWLAKEIVITAVGIAIAYLIIKASF